MGSLPGANHNNPAALLSKLVLVFTQFSNLLPAEHSAEVPYKDKCRWLGGPKAGKRCLAALFVKHGERCKLLN